MASFSETDGWKMVPEHFAVAFTCRLSVTGLCAFVVRVVLCIMFVVSRVALQSRSGDPSCSHHLPVSPSLLRGRRRRPAKRTCRTLRSVLPRSPRLASVRARAAAPIAPAQLLFLSSSSSFSPSSA